MLLVLTVLLIMLLAMLLLLTTRLLLTVLLTMLLVLLFRSNDGKVQTMILLTVCVGVGCYMIVVAISYL